jgi:hypothetical protein
MVGWCSVGVVVPGHTPHCISVRFCGCGWLADLHNARRCSVWYCSGARLRVRVSILSLSPLSCCFLILPQLNSHITTIPRPLGSTQGTMFRNDHSQQDFLLTQVHRIPVGIIKSMTGIEVTLNVLAEFIGGIWVQGNAVSSIGLH